MIEVIKCVDSKQWDQWVAPNGGHPLQLWGWGELKAAHGWKAIRLFVSKNNSTVGAAQVLVRPLPWPLKSLAYIPRGPIVRSESDRQLVLDAVAKEVKASLGSVALTVEPDWLELGGLKGWRRSKNTILIPDTLILDLKKDEDELMAAMTKKTRQYIRKSFKEDIEIRPVKGGRELAACLEIYRQTATRAGFAIHSDDYYYDVFEKLGDNSLIMGAFKGEELIAFLWLATSDSVAFELYGGMNEAGQSLRANYTLKWETIKLTKGRGVECYDMNGLLNDGVSNFKRGFASHETTLVGTYDKPLSLFYPVWVSGLPLAKKIIRAIKKR